MEKNEGNVEQIQEEQKEKFSLVNLMAGCIGPIIPVLIGAGFFKIVLLLCELTGLLQPGNPTYVVMNFVGDAGFYFLPIFAGATAAKQLGANMGLGMLMGAIFIHPTFVQTISEGGALSIFGLPIYATNYTSSIFPIIITVMVMAPIQKFIGKHSPDAIRSITEPFLTILVMLPLALCVLGPIGAFLGNYLSAAVLWLYDVTGFVGVGILAAVFPFLLMTGMHTAFMPYILNSFATLGCEAIFFTSNIIFNLNQGTACLAVALRSKDKEVKSTAVSSAVTAIVGGITEPAMYGINLKYKKPMIGAVVGSFFGACVAGFGKATAYAFAGSGGIFGLPIYISDNISNLLWMIGGCVVGMIVTFAVTLVLYKEQKN